MTNARLPAATEVIAYEPDSNPLRLVYDTWTPRSHFIIVQKTPQQDATAQDLQASYELIGRFLTDNSQYNDGAILSFHCGEWYQKNTDKWHAHLCVPKESYLNNVRTKITKIPRNNQWGNVKTVEEGFKNWYTKNEKRYAQYKDACLNKIIPDQNPVEEFLLSGLNSASREFKLVWTSPTPRISVVALSKTTSTLAALYNFLSQVHHNAGIELGQRDEAFTNFGSHLCLYVSGQSGTKVTCRESHVLTEDGQITPCKDIVGYIQMDECQYVQWLPRNIRQIWRDEFRNAVHFVHT